MSEWEQEGQEGEEEGGEMGGSPEEESGGDMGGGSEGEEESGDGM
jgi:hypothetical protein